MEAALDATTRRALPVIFLGVGGFYMAAMLVTPYLVDSGQQSDHLSLRWFAMATIGAVGALAFRWRPAPAGWANHIAGMFGALVVVNGLLLVDEAGPAFQFAVVVALLAFSLFLLSLPWVVGLCVLALASWGFLGADAGWGPEWAPRAFNLMAFCVVALVAQITRLGLHRRLEDFKLRDLARIAQEHELERERALNEQRRRIVRMTAHELATPLTPVIVQAHLLARGDLSPEQQRNMAMLQRNLDRLQRAIEKVVAAAQADQEASKQGDPPKVDALAPQHR
jgi:signal transduction histidine kinase